MASKTEAHRDDLDRGADRLLLHGKKVSRVAGPGCSCGACKDTDEALAKHGGEARAGLEAITESVTLSLDGEARRVAAIKNPIRQAEAAAEVIERLELRKRGLTTGFRAGIAQYGGAAAADDGATVSAGKPPPIEDVIPWPYPVDAGEVLDAAVGLIRRHVNLPIEAAHALALWCAHSHALDVSWFNPRLAICSPVKRCGKTTLVEVLAGLVARAKPSSGVTPAVVFRMIDLYKPTYLIDEADGYLPENEELRSVLNSGHTRTSATIDRNVKNEDGDWTPASFSTWCPMVVAGIGRLPGTLDDRSIKIRLQRKPRAVKLARFRADRAVGIGEIGRKIARFVADNQIAIGEADVEPPEELHDRAADNWRPLLNIASVVGGEWPERAKDAAKVLEQVDMDADDLGIALLDNMRTIFAREPGGRAAILAGSAEQAAKVRMATNTLLKALLAADEDWPWIEVNNGKALNARGLAQLLKPFGITTHRNVWVDDDAKPAKKAAKGYKLEEFLGAFSSYLPPHKSDHGSEGKNAANPRGPVGQEMGQDKARQGSGRPSDMPLTSSVTRPDPSSDPTEAAESLDPYPLTHETSDEAPSKERTSGNGLDANAQVGT